MSLGVVICKNHVAKPLDSFNKCRNFFLLIWETFFCRNLKNYSMTILSWCNVETASNLCILGLSCSKVARFEHGFIPKTFPGLHFLFSWGLIWLILFWTICLWNKFEEKAQCVSELKLFMITSEKDLENGWEQKCQGKASWGQSQLVYKWRGQTWLEAMAWVCETLQKVSLRAPRLRFLQKVLD